MLEELSVIFTLEVLLILKLFFVYGVIELLIVYFYLVFRFLASGLIEWKLFIYFLLGKGGLADCEVILGNFGVLLFEGNYIDFLV